MAEDRMSNCNPASLTPSLRQATKAEYARFTKWWVLTMRERMSVK